MECSSCPFCQDSVCSATRITLEQLIMLLQAIQCPHAHTSFQGGFHFTAGDVWDDVVEVCDEAIYRVEVGIVSAVWLTHCSLNKVKNHSSAKRSNERTIRLIEMSIL